MNFQFGTVDDIHLMLSAASLPCTPGTVCAGVSSLSPPRLLSSGYAVVGWRLAKKKEKEKRKEEKKREEGTDQGGAGASLNNQRCWDQQKKSSTTVLLHACMTV